MIEEWKPIDGYEGRYEVSNTGKVISLNYGGTKGKVKELAPQDNGRGYLAVGLRDAKGRNSHYVHRLVAQAFIPNPQNFLEVNHLDEDKSNNQVSNLEWCNRKHNVNYGSATYQRASKMSKAVEAVDPISGKIIHYFISTREAHRNGFNASHVSDCCRGLSKTHRGLTWRYA